jgi:CIC family chloride channel protein
VLIYSLAPESEGHGTDAAVKAFHRLDGFVRARVPIIKTIASAITIGSGGAAGREGPTAQIAAGFGSVLGTVLRLPAEERRYLVLIGMASGLSAVFKSPLGTAIFAVEILYRDMAFEGAALVYTLIGAATAYAISGTFNGWTPLFALPNPLDFTGVRELVWYALLGIAAGLLATLIPWVFYRMRDAFHRLAVPPHFKPAIGGLFMGILGMFLPQLLGGGYGWMQLAIDGSLVLWLMPLLALGKLVAMSFTISSGGSGGVFAPTLFIGTMLGGALAAVLQQVTPSAPNPEAFAVVGMAAIFAGAARVPIATLIMVAEMTGGYRLILPTMLAVAISYVVQDTLTRKAKYPTLYEWQVAAPGDSPVHQQEYYQTVVKLLRQRVVTLDPTIVDREFVDRLSRGEPVPMAGSHEFVYMTEVPPDCPVTGATLRDLKLPSDVLIVSVLRGEEAAIPDGNTVLQDGDRLTLVATQESMEAFKALMKREPAPEKRSTVAGDD